MGASPDLLLVWVYSGPEQQGGRDSHATRTLHPTARRFGPDTGSTGGTRTGYPPRGRPPSPRRCRAARSTPLPAHPRGHLLGGPGHGDLDRPADPTGLQARPPAPRRRADPPSLQPLRRPAAAGHRPDAAPLPPTRAPAGVPRDTRRLLSR